MLRDAEWAADQLPDGITEAMRGHLCSLAKPALPAFQQLIDVARYTLSGNATSQVKLNLLAFLEPLCTSDAAAELLINTQLTNAIIENLGAFNSGLKTQAAQTLGLLVRHARHIELPFVLPGADSM